MRLWASRVAMKPAWGPPKPSGTPKRCDEPTTMSAPISPGGRSSTRPSRSAATVTSAPGVVGGRDQRRVVAHLAARSRGTAPARRRCRSGEVGRRRASPTTTSMPSGTARVRTTSMVWGWQSASTRNTRPGLGGEAPAHGHGLGRGGALVEQRGVGQLHAGEVADHGLEVEQRLEPALGDLGLVGRVGRVPGRVLEHVAQDHRRRDGVGVAQPDERGHAPGCGRPASRRRASTSASVSAGGQRQGLVAADGGGHHPVDQLVERRQPQRGQHLGLVGRRRARRGGR